MSQGDAELMAEAQVLDFKPAPGLEEVDEEHCERMQEREHHPRSCGDSTRPCDPRPDEIFGKDIRNQGNSPHISKRIFKSDICEFESSPPQPASPVSAGQVPGSY
jgi:hypothetical protein